MLDDRLIGIERRQRILEHLQTHGSLKVKDAVALLDASAATVRRDFVTLSHDGLVRRDHGGITAAPKLRMTGWVAPYQWRLQVHTPEKKRVAQAAAALLSPGEAMFIDGGTTTLQLASMLPMGSRVITHSLMLAAALGEIAFTNPSLEIYLAGGLISAQLGILCGPQAVETIQNYHPHWAILSTAGIFEGMVMNGVELEVAVERAMLHNAEKVMLLADHSKLGRKALVRMCDVSDVDILVTNKEASESELQAIRALGVECILV